MEFTKGNSKSQRLSDTVSRHTIRRLAQEANAKPVNWLQIREEQEAVKREAEKEQEEIERARTLPELQAELEKRLRSSNRKEVFGFITEHDGVAANEHWFIAVTRDPAMLVYQALPHDLDMDHRNENEQGKSVAFLLEHYLRASGKAQDVMCSTHTVPMDNQSRTGPDKKDDFGYIVVRFRDKIPAADAENCGPDFPLPSSFLAKIFGDIGGRQKQVGITGHIDHEPDSKRAQLIMTRGKTVRTMVEILASQLSEGMTR